jgi:YfiH family protein
MLRPGPDNVFRAAIFDGLNWLDHGFGGTRAGNWVKEEPAATLSQIHSDIVVRAEEDTGCLGKGDALVTDRHGTWLVVRTADCVPVILADPVRQVVAVVHAGWRGTVKGVLERTIDALCVEFATCVSDLRVALGPSIGPCCFEVGPEVAREFQNWFPERSDLDRRTRVDLGEALRRQLVARGVEPCRIGAAGVCTKCEAGEFESYRRDGGRAGRMVTAVRIGSENTKGADRSPRLVTR